MALNPVGAPDHPFLLPDINNGIFYKSPSIPFQGGEAKGEILGGTGGGRTPGGMGFTE